LNLKQNLKKEIKNIIPLAVSILLVIISFRIVLATEYILNSKHYIGMIALGISVLLYYKKKEIYFYFFALTLTAGIINLIDFFYINYLFGIGILEFNPIFLVLLILFLVLNKEKISELFPEKEMNTEKEKERFENKIKNFENKFLNKTEFELRGIIDENSPYVEEARIAGKRLLDKKNVL